ncbi:MAG: L,D-transpeptidase family protein [Cytophagales bacterium]|nr:L,D-transpeptidase family protein [Armatimonadota bacterium]
MRPRSAERSARLVRRVAVYGALAVVLAGIVWARRPLWRTAVTGTALAAGTHTPTVEGALTAYRAASKARFFPKCKAVGIAYPPRRVTLIVLKEEKRLEVWGANGRGLYRRLAVYEILAASGTGGPKRKEGDRQVPEGFYRISALNPASQFHLSLRVDYPNAEDVAHRTVERRALGGDIYVHGGAASIGCVALGDPAIEEVFCLVAQAAPRERRILLTPFDLRLRQNIPSASDPWVRGLYSRLGRTLRDQYPA